MSKRKDRLTEEEREEIRDRVKILAKLFNLDEKRKWRMMLEMAKWTIATRHIDDEVRNMTTFSAEDFNFKVGCAA